MSTRKRRRFATAKQRRALWRASGGKCAICRCDLDHSFHADHVTPWVVSRDTNPHEMQALCPECNLKKGAKMLRRHQQEALEIANASSTGGVFKKVLASVTPGGGKSAIPVIFAERLIARGIADKICWVVPRDSLRKQAERAFLDKRFRAELGHSREIRAATNDINPSRGLDGYATTYQAIANDPDLHAEEFRRFRYVLCLDEGHHVGENGVWHRALQQLVDRAALVLILSGTLSRADGRRIAFLEYTQESGRERAKLENVDGMRVIQYKREQALREKAVLPIYFERVDGHAKWIDTNGTEKFVSSLAKAGDDTSGALYTALRQDYANDLLREMVSHWKSYADVHPRSKFLVVAPNIALANAYLKSCRALNVHDVDIATSEDSDSAKENIDRLKCHKTPELRGLVTVGMAYEGLDCPEITHIACLTHIRSHEWIEQMLARATRVDYQAGEYEEQAAYVWAPDDDLFTAAIRMIQEEQAPFLPKHDGDATASASRQPTSPRDAEYIVPLAAASTAVRGFDMQTGEVVDAEEVKALKEALREVGLQHVSPMKAKQLLEILDSKGIAREATAAGTSPEQTASEREIELRRALDRLVKQAAKGDGDAIREINRTIWRIAGKPRDEMNERELRGAIERVQFLMRAREERDDATA